MKKWFEKWAAEKAKRKEKGLPPVLDYREEAYVSVIPARGRKLIMLVVRRRDEHSNSSHTSLYNKQDPPLSIALYFGVTVSRCFPLAPASIDMLNLFRRRSSAAQPTSTTMGDPQPSKPSPTPTPPPPVFSNRFVQPYEVPDPKGTCHLLLLPDEILASIFTKLDRVSLTRCHRVCISTLSLPTNLTSQLCTRLHDFPIHNSVISLHHLLQCNSLRLNPSALKPSSDPNQIPTSTAELLATLRERLTRFRNFKPKQSFEVELEESDGRLYEFLEGVLLRGVGERRILPRELAVYDLRRLGDWVDIATEADQGDNTHEQMEGGMEDGAGVHGEAEVEDTQSEAGKPVRITRKFGFEIAEFAVDPGADLLVLVEVRYESLAWLMVD